MERMMGNRVANKAKMTKVSILCEGQIEYNYFWGYKKAKDYEKIVIEIKVLPSPDYKSVKNYIKKNLYGGIPLVVLDLDRASDSNESQALDMLIAEIKNSGGFLFFTYKCFEDWILAHFEEKRLEKIFGVQGRSDLKKFFAQSYDLYSEITKRKGSIERAISHFSSKPLFLNLDFQKDRQHLQTEQSSLFLLEKILQRIGNPS